MASTDGSVVIGVDMNIGDAEKRLAKLRRDIKKTEEDIRDMTNKRDAAQEKSVFQTAELDAEKEKLEEIKAKLAEIRRLSTDKSISVDQRGRYAAQIPAVKQELADQNTLVRGLQAEWNKTQNAIDTYNQKIGDANLKLTNMQEEAGALTQEIDKANKSQGLFKRSADASGEAMGRIVDRVKRLAGRVFIFSVISRAMYAILEVTKKYIQTNDEARQAIAQLKGALLTLAQPILNVIIPAFTLLVNVLTRIVSAVARFVSFLFGKSLNQAKEGAKAMYEEANAINEVGDAAEDASGSFAEFDEIKTINTEDQKSSAGGSAGAGAGAGIEPDFETTSNKFKGIIDDLMVYLSGALLVIGAILLFSGANIPLGLGLMVLGAMVLAQEIAENWGEVDGKINDAVKRVFVILGGALFVIGAILCFSGANIPLGIGLMVLGAAMFLSSATLDWGSTGEELRSALASLLQIIGPMIAIIGVILVVSGHILLGIALIIAGIAIFEAGKAAEEDGDFIQNIRDRLTEALEIIGTFLAVLGVFLLLTGHILLGLGLFIAGVALFEYSKVKDDEGMSMQEKIKTTLENTLDVISPFLAILGLILLFTGHILLGLGLFIAGVALFEYSKVKDDEGMSMQEKIKTVLTNTLIIVSAFLLVIGLILLFFPPMLPTAIALIAAGAVGLVTAAALESDVIKNKLKEMWQGIKDWWNSSNGPKKFLTLEYWKDLGKKIIDGFLDGLKKAWDGLTSWFTGVWDKLFGNRNVSVDVKGTSSAGKYNSGSGMAVRSIPEIAVQDIPALAQGAVIPPNREFLAVLGDQRNGTNIEAPLQEIENSVMRAMQRLGIGEAPQVNINFGGSLAQLARLLQPYITIETGRLGPQLVTGGGSGR